MKVAVAPLERPPDAVVRVPGSKSITNRALVAAALAHGTSTLTGVLRADDTDAMVTALRHLGTDIRVSGDRAVVDGHAGALLPAREVAIDARDAATVGRFLLPVLATSGGVKRVDGSAQLRARPMGPLVDALRALGARVGEEGEPGCLPLTVEGPITGGVVRLRGDVSSQFASALMLVAPLIEGGVRVEFTTTPVSLPYLGMTAQVMRAFGADAVVGEHGVEVPAGTYTGCDFAVEPDASSASYFFAAAAVCRGRVTVDGLPVDSLQGDVRFVEVLERMGAAVSRDATSITVTGGELEGVDSDLSAISDTAPTLAAVAPFAASETRVRGIGFIRSKESDRIGHVVAELGVLGVDATDEGDGYAIRPSRPRAGVVSSHGDHRLAMAFAVIGLRVPGVEIDGAECVSKTYPGFFTDLDQLRQK